MKKTTLVLECTFIKFKFILDDYVQNLDETHN